MKLVEGVFDQADLERFVTELTEAVVRVGGEGIRPAVNVTVEEIKSGLYGSGGMHLTTELLRTRRAQRAAAAAASVRSGE
jgi:4-oxalocrotonate tautomerase